MINFDDNGLFWLNQIGSNIYLYMTDKTIEISYDENKEPIVIPLRKLAEANMMYLTDEEMSDFTDTVKYEIEKGFNL